MREYEQLADSLRTSEEVLEAIMDLETEDRGYRSIWDDPTREEVIAIWERVTGNGNRDAQDFFWGDSPLDAVLKDFS